MSNASSSTVVVRETANQSDSHDSMPVPTLGCQIAPDYSHEAWPYKSDSSESESESEEHVGSALQSGSAPDALDLDRAETQGDDGMTVTPAKTRTRNSRKEVQQDPVGFWHWSMVCFCM